MTLPIRVPYEMPQTKEEIIALFGWQNFTDPNGHPLTLNMDFLALVDVYCAASKIFCVSSSMSKEEADQRHAITRAFLAGQKSRSCANCPHLSPIPCAVK